MKQGFTLIELSIVLVIIGLIVGGVLVGQDLIKAAQLRKIITQKEAFQAAANTFRLKYNCMAGDCNNATDFFGTATCPGDAGDPRTNGTTCNGNGNKQIYSNASGGGQNESFGFWQHLAIAGLIDGNYTGVTDHATLHYGSGTTIGGNVPAGPLPNSMWSVYWLGSVPISSVVHVEGNYGNVFYFSASNENYHLATSVILTQVDALGLDSKVDDGYPMTGNIVVTEGNPNGTSCFRSNVGGVVSPSNSAPRAVSTTIYYPSIDSVGCSLIFKSVF